MKATGAAIQGGLALLGLGLAYGAWQTPPDKAPGEVVILDASKNEVAKIHYDDDKGNWVEVYRVLEGEPSVWVKMSARPDAKLPEREVRGNEAAEKLFQSFAPLKGTRSLGAVDDKKLAEYGLEKTRRKIQVTARGDKRDFTVGTPVGSFSPYLRDERDKHVYTLGGNLLGDLESASSRMVDRTFHAFKPTEFDGVLVTAGGKKRDLTVISPEQPNAKLASRATPDKPDETAKNWHDKIWRMYGMDVLGKGEKPVGGEPQIALRVDYSWKGKDKGFVEIGRLSSTVTPPTPPAKPGAAPAPAPNPVTTSEIYVRSEHTAGWVKLGGNPEDLIKDGIKVAEAQ